MSAEALGVLEPQVDIVLLDFDLGEDHGSQFIAAARRAGYAGKILMVTAGMDAAESSIALQLGASGIFLKHNSPVTLAKAIRLVSSGEMWVDQRVIHLMADGIHRREGRDLSQGADGAGATGAPGHIRGPHEQGDCRPAGGIEASAVKATLQQLFQKTRVRTRSQLVRIALESSLGATRKL